MNTGTGEAAIARGEGEEIVDAVRGVWWRVEACGVVEWYGSRLGGEGARTIAEPETQLLARPPCPRQSQGHTLLAWARCGVHRASMAWRGLEWAWRGWCLTRPRVQAQGVVCVLEGTGASAKAPSGAWREEAWAHVFP